MIFFRVRFKREREEEREGERERGKKRKREKERKRVSEQVWPIFFVFLSCFGIHCLSWKHEFGWVFKWEERERKRERISENTERERWEIKKREREDASNYFGMHPPGILSIAKENNAHCYPTVFLLVWEFNTLFFARVHAILFLHSTATNGWQNGCSFLRKEGL